MEALSVVARPAFISEPSKLAKINGDFSLQLRPFCKKYPQNPSCVIGKINANDIVQSPSNVFYNLCEFFTYKEL